MVVLNHITERIYRKYPFSLINRLGPSIIVNNCYLSIKGQWQYIFFIPDIGKTGHPDYEYAISFHQKCFVLELFHRKYSVRPPSWINF
jgi:hypothetical protein